jgi:hypothetical protein
MSNLREARNPTRALGQLDIAVAGDGHTPASVTADGRHPNQNVEHRD